MAETTTLRAYLDDLERLLDQEAPTEVISHCRHILQHFPHHVDTYRVLGKALLLKANQEDAAELFDEAGQVFRRVLSALPNDYVAHLGLSQVCDRQGELNQAIWHLERAYEQMPGNAALQEALRELYVKRDGAERAPARIQLTRGALARQYMQGQLYEQAVAELKTALSQQPARLDLQTLLAEALWAARHEVEAGEVAIELLKRLPNSLTANRIMAQLWLDNERPTDAKPFLDRVEALDPYAAARILQPDGELPDPTALPRLDYYRHSQAMLSAEAPGWVQELGTPGQDISMEELFTLSEEQDTESSLGRGIAAPPSQIDLSALFGEPPIPEPSDLWESDNISEQAGPSAGLDQFHPPTPDPLSEFPVPDVSWFDETAPEQPVAAEETDEAAIEADWVLDTDEKIDRGSAVEEVPDWQPPAATDLWDELSAPDDDTFGVLARTEDTTSTPPQRAPIAEISDADFLEHLGETPDFDDIGVDEIDWSTLPAITAESDTAQETLTQPQSSVEQQTAAVESEGLPQQWLEHAERPIDAALDHSDEQHLRDEMDAAFEDLLIAENLVSEAAESIAIPEWLPHPDEVVDTGEESNRQIPSLDELAAALQQDHAPEHSEEEQTLAALEESLEWLDGALDSHDTDLLAALAAAAHSEDAVGETEAEPAPALPDWLREAAPRAEAAPEQTDQVKTEQAWSPVEAEALPLAETEAAPAWMEPEPSAPAEWETFEAEQAQQPEEPRLVGEPESAWVGVTAEEDWLRALAQQEEEPTHEAEPQPELTDSGAAPASTWEQAPLLAEEVMGETGERGEMSPGSEASEPTAELAAQSGPDWLADEWPTAETPQPPADTELEGLLSQPYDPFEGGSPENVPRYQAANETGILQPDERPDWMTAFLGDELPETELLPDSLPSSQEESVTRPLAEEEIEKPTIAPPSTEQPAEAAMPSEEWLATEETVPGEGAIPDWLAAIADSEANKLAELFATDEVFSSEEETLTEAAAGLAEEPGLESVEAFDLQGDERFAMPETHEHFFAPIDLEQVETEVAQAAPSEAPSAAQTETSPLAADEYADEPVPEDFSFGDWVPIWLRVPLEGQPGEWPGLDREVPPAPPEWLRDVSEEDD